MAKSTLFAGFALKVDSSQQSASKYNVLCDKLLPKTPEENTYKQIVQILDEHFNPTPNEILKNYCFHLRKQKAEETCEKFLLELSKLAVHCNFGMLLERKTVNLEDAVKIATAYEGAGKGGMELHRTVHQSSAEMVNKIHGIKRRGLKKSNQNLQPSLNVKKAKKKCYRCGSPTHLAKEFVKEVERSIEELLHIDMSHNNEKPCGEIAKIEKDKKEARY
ncbi:uncharacterized protein LOC119684351 [Teleopsis dalmanni]|uniref:uncharacterized protein LOC119684351 n=1 Tax=Teleopsis dalmanni TaxID=139649 RepID=UPI0018CCE8F5|nr:uncharacterized protein LOC119684351 [Teleopsis dalmanni]